MLNLSTVPARVRSRVLEQYFTRPEIGDLLVGQMTLASAAHVVELGAGEGSLLAAARRRWQAARLTSVDIDRTLRVVDEAIDGHKHLVMNVLSPAFARNRRLDHMEFDAAVCNPPYQVTELAVPYRSLLKRVGLQAALPREGGMPADLVFLAHNLRLLRHGGQMGIIVPDGTVTGSRSRPLREALLASHALHSVIELPSRAFPGTDAKTFILTLEKGGVSPDRIPLYCADHNAYLSDPLYISVEEAVCRMDYRFYAWRRSATIPSVRSLGDFAGVQIIRGRWNATEARSAGLPILHSTNIPGAGVSRSLSLSQASIRRAYGDAPRASAGDIVLTRVGRHLEERFARVASGESVISDCLYVVRGPATIMAQFWRSLNSAQGHAYLAANARGVCARVLNRSSLLDYPLPLTDMADDCG
ncbi:type I restriction enzyme M protein [Xanthomonas sp. JAI131]|uniref:N-6 DNA methylase n=1 Tax=Xanthomonas sp. JAI131 TaxID=2723067 RepID=UPI0015CC0B21|nr:N-6 DNA methylase [Xanthomonas sp. JAI131]NYF22627.1 type I restriction enzyme M protein [Xanthomonas sp. JAI131]